MGPIASIARLVGASATLENAAFQDGGRAAKGRAGSGVSSRAGSRSGLLSALPIAGAADSTSRSGSWQIYDLRRRIFGYSGEETLNDLHSALQSLGYRHHDVHVRCSFPHHIRPPGIRIGWQSIE